MTTITPEVFTQQLDQCYNILTQQMVIINTLKEILADNPSGTTIYRYDIAIADSVIDRTTHIYVYSTTSYDTDNPTFDDALEIAGTANYPITMVIGTGTMAVTMLYNRLYLGDANVNYVSAIGTTTTTASSSLAFTITKETI